MSPDAWTTARLRLRPFRWDDRLDVARLLSHPEVMRFSSGLATAEQAERWLHDAITRRQPLHLSESTRWAGYCGLFQLQVNGQPEVELGYRLLPEFWGQGLAVEAGQEVLRLAAESGHSRIVSLIDPANVASRKVAQRLGMSLEGEVMMPGYDHPDLLYATRWGRSG